MSERMSEAQQSALIVLLDKMNRIVAARPTFEEQISLMEIHRVFGHQLKQLLIASVTPIERKPPQSETMEKRHDARKRRI